MDVMEETIRKIQESTTSASATPAIEWRCAQEKGRGYAARITIEARPETP